MKNKITLSLFWFFLGVFFLLSHIIKSACNWFDMRFGVSFEEVLFTITSPLAGSDVSFLDEATEYVISDIAPAFGTLIVLLLLVIFLRRVFIQLQITLGKFKFNLD